MLQLPNCGLEEVKTWKSHNIFLEGSPLDNSQGKEGLFIGILASVNLRNVIEWQYLNILWAVYNRQLCHLQLCVERRQRRATFGLSSSICQPMK